MKRIAKTMLLISVLFVTVLQLSGCGKNNGGKNSNSIVGSWKYEGGGYTYTFNEDGTGTYEVGSTKMEFTYKIDGDKISILYKGNTTPFETKYNVNGEKLNVVDSLGKDTIYNKVK